MSTKPPTQTPTLPNPPPTPIEIPTATPQLHISPQATLIQPFVKFTCKTISFPRITGRIPRLEPDTPVVHFLYLSDVAFQIREVRKDLVNELYERGELEYGEILGNSGVGDFYEYEEISRFDHIVLPKESTKDVQHYLVGVYFHKIQGAGIVIRLTSPQKTIQFSQKGNQKLKQQRQFLKKSTLNFLGIEQNIRKIVQKVLITSPTKRQIYTRLTDKLQEKGIQLKADVNRIVLFSLMARNGDMESVVRKERIQAYDLERRRYDQVLREEVGGVGGTGGDGGEMGRGYVVDKYSQKRKLDGAIIRKLPQKQPQTQSNLYPTTSKLQQQELYLSKIPTRLEYELDQLIHIQYDQSRKGEGMELMEQRRKKDLPITPKANCIRIPQKQFSIIGRDVQIIRERVPGINQVLDRSQVLIIQSIKFLYQIMRAACKQRHPSLSSSTSTPTYHPDLNPYTNPYTNKLEQRLQQVCECTKEIINEMEMKLDRKALDSRFLGEFIKLGNKNYMDYRKKKFNNYLF